MQVHLLDGDSGQDISYGNLLEASSEVAAGLVEAGLRRNEAVAVMLPTSDDFFYAFFGVALAGGIAVPSIHRHGPMKSKSMCAVRCRFSKMPRCVS